MLKRFAALFLWLGASACTTPQLDVSSSLQPATNPSTMTLLQPLTVKPPRAPSLTLKQGSTWSEVGNITQGQVMKPLNQVVVINSFNVYEAYIVVTGGQLVGFYLPVTKGFVEAGPAKIDLKASEE